MVTGRQHTAGPTPDASSQPFTERKHKPGGEVQSFPVTLIHRSPGLAVVRFVLPGPSSPRIPLRLAAGTLSDGYFWARRPYSVYRFQAPGGPPLGHRFDAVGDVRISAEAVDYWDLALDWWAFADGTLIEEDRDELTALAAAGVLSPADLARANRAARAVSSRYRHIIDECAAIEAKVEG